MTRDYDYYVIKVDEVKDGIPQGRIVNPCIQETIEYHDLGDMILKINEAMHRLKIKAKQAKTEELFTFHSFREFGFAKSPKYFFLVRMIRSDDIFWHGIVEGSSGRKKGFKSALDLMSRIDEVIRNGDKNKLHRIREARG